MNKNAQQGFTLIELIMVIVILGILAATALPKFADLGSDARKASLKAARGSVQSAMAIVHAKSLIDGTAKSGGTSLSLDGTRITIRFGYPRLASIMSAAGLDPVAYMRSGTNIFLTSKKNTRINNCYFTYTEARSSTRPPSVGEPVERGC